MLFTGTLRKNLDPFLQHGDLQLWKALAEVRVFVYMCVCIGGGGGGGRVAMGTGVSI